MIAQQYLDGVWYDVEYDTFVTLDWDDDNDLVHICDEESEPLEVIEEVDFVPGDYYRIPDEIIEDPADFLEGRIRRLHSGYYDGDRGTKFREEVCVQYAADHVDIVERDEMED